jgi:CheY-like chemotaxis protein
MTKHRIMVVDDENPILETRALFLQALGYEVSTAKHGFDALMKLKNGLLPDLIITDLNMPRMSGFELLPILRRMFPGILVIASSGAFDFESDIPGGLIADAFHAKAGPDPASLWKMTAALLASPCPRTSARYSCDEPNQLTRKPISNINTLEGTAYGTTRSRTAS